MPQNGLWGYDQLVTDTPANLKSGDPLVGADDVCLLGSSINHWDGHVPKESYGQDEADGQAGPLRPEGTSRVGEPESPDLQIAENIGRRLLIMETPSTRGR